MPILNVPDEIELELTHKCNWNCRYCAIRTHSLPPVSEKDALAKVEAAAGRYKTVTFSGGEPGLLRRAVLEKMLDTVASSGSRVCLNTNGTMMKRYPDLAERFDQVIYHCSRDLVDRLVPYLQLRDVRYMLVVDDVNYPRLKYYLENNKETLFDVVPASYEPGDSRKPLSVYYRMQIVERFRDRITPESLRRLFVDKDFDRVKYL